MNLSEIDRLRIGKFEFTLKPDIWLHTREMGTSREEGKQLEGALSAALRAWYAQPDGYAGMEWQDYLEKTLAQTVQPIFVEARFQANEIRPAMHKYSAKGFNLDKGELLEEEPLVYPPRPPIPASLQVGELRKLRHPEPGEPAKFLIKSIQQEPFAPLRPRSLQTRATIVEIMFEDGSRYEFAPEFIRDCTDPV